MSQCSRWDLTNDLTHSSSSWTMIDMCWGSTVSGTTPTTCSEIKGISYFTTSWQMIPSRSERWSRPMPAEMQPQCSYVEDLCPKISYRWNSQGRLLRELCWMCSDQLATAADTSWTALRFELLMYTRHHWYFHRSKDHTIWHVSTN